MSQLALRLKGAGVKAIGATFPEYAAKAAKAIFMLATGIDSTGPEVVPLEFTAEDVRELAGDPPHPNALGAALSTAARRGSIIAVGWQASTRTAARGRPLRVWMGG